MKSFPTEEKKTKFSYRSTKSIIYQIIEKCVSVFVFIFVCHTCIFYSHRVEESMVAAPPSSTLT